MADDDKDLDEFKTALGLHIENPWERVKFLFLRNPHGELHPEIQNVISMAELGFLGGVAIGGTLHQKRYLEEVKERSDAKVFNNIKQAYRHLSQESLKGFVKGALIWGPRMSVFAGGFTLFTACAEAFRNKSGIIEYSMGASVLGALLRFNYGIRGMLVGGFVGSILGTVYGVTHLGLCKLTQTDGVQIKYAQYAFSKYLEEKTNRNLYKENDLERILDVSNSDPRNPLNALPDDETEN